jgi:hypothetical protein
MEEIELIVGGTTPAPFSAALRASIQAKAARRALLFITLIGVMPPDEVHRTADWVDLIE